MQCLKLLFNAHLHSGVLNQQQESLLHICCQENHPECLELILGQERVNLDQQDRERNTAVMVAVKEVAPECLMALIDAKANLDFQDRYGDTAAHWTVVRDQPVCLRLLIEGGCRLHLKSKLGETAFDVARKRNVQGCLEVFRQLEMSL